MKSRKSLIAIAVSFAAYAGLGTISQASAAIMTATYTGTVNTGFDYAGIFGGGNLNGQSFTEVFEYDTSLGFSSSGSAVGGSEYGLATPILSASLTINGATFTVSGNYYGDIYAPVDGLNHLFSVEAIQIVNGLYQDVLQGGIESSAIPLSISSPFTASSTLSYLTIADIENGIGYDDITLLAQNLSVTQTSVAEPGSIALFGAGLLGLFGIRRKKTPAGSVPAISLAA